MTLTEEELRRERDEHLLVADAMASVRLFRAMFGDGEQTREWIRELARTMYRVGCRERHGERETLLATTADAIARSYLGRSVRELEWPQAGG
ncbi:hypothetical protein JL101_013030 [Skermanella rosea]|uniref:hypothetical protein n=1 Tax=Skermanella rosea TaxID=1817965 RepID=UPI001933F71F|nr:hypothetical protein [Skermanella rosea]UEM06312.1 hypothetical protein JL101_013030 [Skermanella rosea]